MSETHFTGVDTAKLEIDSVEVTSSAAELNALDGSGLSAAEMAAMDGVAVVVKSISKVCAVGDFTDNADATGYIDFTASSLPADSIVLGWKCVTSEAWDDDTTAVISVGVSGTLDLYSATTTGSVAAAGTVGSVCKTTGVVFNEAAATPRVTITGGSDFTVFVTAADCSSTVTMYYIPVT